LINGGWGFIGLNLTAALQQANAKLSILSQSWPPTSEHAHQILEGAPLYKAIRDASPVETAVTGCDIVFHLAGKSGCAAGNNSPLEDLDVSVIGVLTLLEACRRRSPSAKVVFPSSRLVFSPDVPSPVIETAETVPLSIYGIHKLAAERYMLLYQRLYGVRSTILRITNPYGPFRRPERNSYGVVN
jgi:nucleoside-diphosphate-sugar epimerase